MDEFLYRLNPTSLILFLTLALGIPAFAVALVILQSWTGRIRCGRGEGVSYENSNAYPDYSPNNSFLSVCRFR